MKVATQALLLGALVQGAFGDIYMHNPRGSNNRNCRSDNTKARRNANRLFDSQNNDNGGYSCPRAWPFDCYKDIEDETAYNECAAQNENPTKEMVDSDGNLVNDKAIQTPMMYFYSGSMLSLEWTVQHGMGTNSELHSQMVVQYSCEDLLQDNCGETATTEAGTCSSPFQADPSLAKVCGPRDGTPVRVTDGDTQLNVEATKTIEENADTQDDMRYGRHETYKYYQECRARERNKGLFTADQKVNGNTARHTRQNPNANRYGFECPEESEYYPYWHHSPWKDVAVILENDSKCDYFKQESQNVKARGRCDCAGKCNGDGKQPNNKVACETEGYTWCEDPAHGIDPPDCVVGEYNRQNHLGNTAAGTSSNQYNWTLPQVDKPMKCMLRLRYNISTMDFESVTESGTYSQSNKASPLADNDENEAATYLSFTGVDAAGASLGFAVNTDQYGRTFQDRSYMFEIRPAPTDGPCEGRKIHNLNVRGKRGNIVQTYPAVEYDFTPTSMTVQTNECIHVQWTGSDYNPDRNGNDAEAGPYSSGNRNKETKSDRSNLALMANPGDNFPITDLTRYKLFDTTVDTYKRLLWLDQKVEDSNVCWSFEKLQETYNNRAEREEHHQNCMKLSGQKTPYFDAGALRVGDVGNYYTMSTRNNNFSNRGQKGRITVVPGGLHGAGLIGVVGGSAGLAVLGAALFIRHRRKSQAGRLPKSTGAAPAIEDDGSKKSFFAGGFWKKGSNSSATSPTEGEYVEAIHFHSAAEPGELTFRKGDRIRVISRDASGWWEGEVNGDRGVFPANYTK